MPDSIIDDQKRKTAAGLKLDVMIESDLYLYNTHIEKSEVSVQDRTDSHWPRCSALGGGQL